MSEQKQKYDIDELISAAARELKIREGYYPRRVKEGKMKEADMLEQMECQRGILKVLKWAKGQKKELLQSVRKVRVDYSEGFRERLEVKRAGPCLIKVAVWGTDGEKLAVDLRYFRGLKNRLIPSVVAGLKSLCFKQGLECELIEFLGVVEL